jgi:dipeptidyl aminopeptidase/acylaminoacyl peptidase
MNVTVKDLLEVRSTVLADYDHAWRAADRLLVRSDLSGTMQLYEVVGGGPLQAITALPEPVGAAAYVTGTRKAVVQADTGGNERHQLYVADLDAALAAPLESVGSMEPLATDHRYGHHLAGVSPDGRRVAYLSNKRNGTDFDLWLADLTTGEEAMIYGEGGYCMPSSGFSPDGRWVSLIRPGPFALDTDVVLVDTRSGESLVPLAHPGEAAWVGAPAWAGAQVAFIPCNAGRDHTAIVRLDLESGEKATVPSTGEDYDCEAVTSRDGNVLLIIENRNGANVLRLFDTRTGEAAGEVPTPEAGVVSSFAVPVPVLPADGSRVLYTITTPRRAGEVWRYDRASQATARLTRSPSPVDPEALVAPEIHEVVSFDGERIAVYLFRPPGLPEHDRPPVILNIHGGPESQAMLLFNPMVQACALAGFAVAVPNVRGSTGYGKRFAALDDTVKRLDSVKDLEAIHGWLDGAGLDGGRAVLWGGSYGGYMVLAGLAFQPHLWAAGVDIVGISDLVTFLENTSAYRRAHREREYGSLARDREFLESASPLRRAGDIRAPLFVIHGRNDPRVPVTEAEQLAEALAQNGVRCDLSIYDNEGHGLVRLENRIDAYTRALSWLDEVLGTGAG